MPPSHQSLESASCHRIAAFFDEIAQQSHDSSRVAVRVFVDRFEQIRLDYPFLVGEFGDSMVGKRLNLLLVQIRQSLWFIE